MESSDEWWALGVGIRTIVVQHLLMINNFTAGSRDSDIECILSKFASVTKQLIHWGEGVAARGALTGLGGNTLQISWSWKRPSAKSLINISYDSRKKGERCLHCVQCFKDKTIEVPTSVWIVKEFVSWHTLESQELFLAKPWGLCKA